jgi:hypothetical protein
LFELKDLKKTIPGWPILKCSLVSGLPGVIFETDFSLPQKSQLPDEFLNA